ncbi:MAG TPA: hypothetical protein VNR37_06355 [Microbacteriaceae bacterium]|nr:hypothetical protein [Microbacteriaceae bacterium]
MQILYAIAIGAVIGVIVRYTIPGRRSHGMALVPGAAAAATAAAWAILAWLGWDWSVGWIWVISLGAALAVALVLALVTPGARQRADAAFFDRAKRA